MFGRQFTFYLLYKTVYLYKEYFHYNYDFFQQNMEFDKTTAAAQKRLLQIK